MKKNEKGFVLIELLIVAVFTATLFTLLYTNVIPLIGDYNQRENYDTSEIKYALYDIRKEILDYKFNDKSYYYRAFSNILLNNKNICKILKSYDIIVPVPIHKKRKFQRGYNQAELITKQIAIELNKSGLSKFKSVNILVKNNIIFFKFHSLLLFSSILLFFSFKLSNIFNVNIFLIP